MLSLNRPEKRNAMSPDMLVTMCDHLRRLEAEGTTRVLIIRGQGTQAFTSGYDIGRLPARQDGGRLTQSDEPSLFTQMIEEVRKFSAPVIAMVHGFCMGGGLELAATCDIRLAADTAVFRGTPGISGKTPAGVSGTVNVVLRKQRQLTSWWSSEGSRRALESPFLHT
jgi:enoyl-CoA hydratase/carnithine racemase